MDSSIMNLRFNILKRLIVIPALSVLSCTAAASPINHATASKKSFINCTFSATYADSPHFAIKPHKNGSEYGCSIALRPVNFMPAGGMSAVISIMPATDLDENSNSAGFSKNKRGNWAFVGYPFLIIEPIKYIALKTSKHDKNDDITLIGRELQSGYIAQGGPLLVKGISVFRITPSYYLSAQLGFEPSVPDATQAAVESELVKIVESIKINAPATTATNSPSH